MGKYVVFDNNGIIHESNDRDDAQNEFEQTKEFKGDLIFAEIIARRHQLISFFFWRGEIIPTIRSYFDLEQFETVLQKMAHDEAIKAVQTLNPEQTVRIVIHSGRISEFGITGYRGSGTGFRFYPNHITYNHGDGWDNKQQSERNSMSIDIEEKLFTTSNHSSKIWFQEGRDKKQTLEKKEQIIAFIDKIMKDAGMKPIPRFSLADTVSSGALGKKKSAILKRTAPTS